MALDERDRTVLSIYGYPNNNLNCSSSASHRHCGLGQLYYDGTVIGFQTLQRIRGRLMDKT